MIIGLTQKMLVNSIRHWCPANRILKITKAIGSLLFQQMVNLEQVMLLQEISIPVYFSKYDTDLNSIIEDISKIKIDDTVDDITDVKGPGERESALSEIIDSISANGYQVSKKKYWDCFGLAKMSGK